MGAEDVELKLLLGADELVMFVVAETFEPILRAIGAANDRCG